MDLVHDGGELGVLLVGAVDEVDGAVKVLHVLLEGDSGLLWRWKYYISNYQLNGFS